MSQKHRRHFARVVALFAAKRIFPWVNSHMCFEVTSCCARVVTLRAIEGLLTWMSQQVCLESISCGARVATLIALERLFSRMFPHVLLQISSFCAGVLTLVAAVGLDYILQRFFRDFCHFTSKSSVGCRWCRRLKDNWTQKSSNMTYCSYSHKCKISQQL